MTTYLILSIAIICGVMQASLDRAGVGQVEALPPSPLSNILVALSIPITLLSNIGLIIVCIWSAIAIKQHIQAVAVIVGVFVVYSLIWGAIVASLRRAGGWENILSIGVGLVFVLRLVTASSVIIVGLINAGYVRL